MHAQGTSCGSLYRNVFRKALDMAPANKSGILAIGAPAPTKDARQRKPGKGAARAEGRLYP